MIVFRSMFQKRTLLYALITYDTYDIEPRVSYGYQSTVASDYWGLLLQTFEALIYPLNMNLYEALQLLENGGDEAMLQLFPSDNYVPLQHNRWDLLRIVQDLMKERTGSNKCRSIMAKNLEIGIDRLQTAYRSKAKGITMHLLEAFSLAAGVKLSAVFKRYYDTYSTDPSRINFDAYPRLSDEKLKEMQYIRDMNY